MNPDAPATFGRTPAQSARAAVLLGLLGGAAVVGVGRYLTAPRGPLGQAYAATGLPEWLAPGFGGLAVAALALAGFIRSIREAPRFAITSKGLRINGTLGEFLVAWANVEAAEVTGTGALGLRIRSREELLESHRGTPSQREWLRSMEPIGGWDLLYPAADLGHSAETVRAWLEPYLRG